MHDRVHLLQERDRLEVLAPAEPVGHPLAVVPRVVEVEHRGHRVDPQAVDVHLLQPVAGAGDQEVPDLVAPEVEHQRAPVGVLALAGVGVLVERGAVEAGQRPLVPGEVGRHPVDDHADAAAVEVVDQVAEPVGVAVAGRGGEVAGDLVAPRRHVGVLGGRQQLDVGEPEVGDVVGQLLGQLAVVEAAPVGVAHPRAEVHLVDRHALVPRAGRGPLGHPAVVLPVVGGAEHDAGVRRRHLGGLGERVGPEAGLAVGPDDLVLVAVPGPGLGDEDLPHTGRPQRAHGVHAAVPPVPVADHPDRAGRRAPTPRTPCPRCPGGRGRGRRARSTAGRGGPRRSGGGRGPRASARTTTGRPPCARRRRPTRT